MQLTKWWGRSVTQFRSYNDNVKRFIFANIFIQIGMGMFAVMYNLYIRELGMPDTVSGKVISVTAIATALMLVPAGFLSDKIGRKKVLIAGAFFAVFTLYYRSIVIVEEPIVYTAFLTGLFMAFFQVSGVPFLAENSKSSERVHLFSLHFALMTLSAVVGSLAGGIIADAVQWAFEVPSYVAIRIALLTGAVTFTIGLGPLFRLTDRPSGTDEVPREERSVVTRVQQTAFKPNMIAIIHFSFAGLLIGLGSGLVVPYLNLYFANRFDASNSYIGFILALGSAMTAVAMLIGPRLVRRIGKVNAIVAFQLLSIPFLLITAFTQSLWIASVGFLLRQALMNAANPIQSAVAMEIVADKYKGLANSMNQMVFQVGWASMAPIATGLVIAHGSYWGYVYTFGITSCLYLAAAAYYYIAFGKKKLSRT